MCRAASFPEPPGPTLLQRPGYASNRLARVTDNGTRGHLDPTKAFKTTAEAVFTTMKLN